MAKLTFHTFPFKKQNGANHLLEKQKVGMAKRVTHQAGSSFCEGRVTLVVGEQLYPNKHFGSPSQANSVKVRQSEHV